MLMIVHLLARLLCSLIAVSLEEQKPKQQRPEGLGHGFDAAEVTFLKRWMGMTSDEN